MLYHLLVCNAVFGKFLFTILHLIPPAFALLMMMSGKECLFIVRLIFLSERQWIFG